MKKLIIFIVFVFTGLTNAITVNINEIFIPKNYKIENTFSGDLSNDESFHLIFAKDKKNKLYKVFSYLFNGDEIEELPSLENKESYSVISFHQNKDILSLFITYNLKKKSFFKKIEYNLNNKTISESEAYEHKDFLTSIRLKNRSILLYKNDEFFKVMDFSKTQNAITKKYHFSSKNDDVFAFFKGKTVTSIKTDEYVPKGAVNDVRLYFKDDELLFTRDSDEPLNISIVGISLNNKKTNVTEVLKIDLKGAEIVPKIASFHNQKDIKYKKATSYISDGKLFQLALSKNEGFIKISDVFTNATLNTIALDNSLSAYIKGNENFIGLEKFLKTAAKNRYNATVTVNKTKTNQLRLRIDYVDVSYDYNYNWWWHHQQFMWHMQQHQNMMIQQSIQRSIPSGFGPIIINDDVFLNATIADEDRYFELVIDHKGQLLNDDLPELIFPEIDKEHYIDKLEDIAIYKYESSCFLSNSFRFIAYNIKSKMFTIQTDILK